MAQSNPLSVAQMTAVLDNAPVAVYVSAFRTWELRMRTLARKHFAGAQAFPHHMLPGGGI